MEAKNADTRRFGNHVKDLRDSLGLTQGELSRKTDRYKTKLSRSYISRIEAGAILMPSKGTLESLAKALDTNVTDLLTFAGYVVHEGARPEETGEFDMTLTRLKGMNLTQEEKDNILMAIEVAFQRINRKKSQALEHKKLANNLG